MYPWDDLRPEDSDEAVCSYLCATYEACIANEPGCESTCEADIRDCSTVQKEELRDCVDELNSECGEVTAAGIYEACVLLVPCYSE